jgi:hypothetical protein
MQFDRSVDGVRSALLDVEVSFHRTPFNVEAAAVAYGIVRVCSSFSRTGVPSTSVIQNIQPFVS